MKQASHQWNQKFTNVAPGQGFMQSQNDHSLFIKWSPNAIFIALIVYVDDIIITSDNNNAMLQLKYSRCEIYRLPWDWKSLNQNQGYLCVNENMLMSY